jgi:hypothetical protein
MEKPSELPVSGKPPGFVEHDSAEPPSRRRSIVAARYALIALSLFFIHTVWFACSSHSTASLTIEERAYKILRETPLIGETTATIYAAGCRR